MHTLITYGPPSRRGKTSDRNRGRSPSHKWLLLQLRRMVAKVNAKSDGNSPPPEVFDDGSSDWEDDDYAYFQYNLPGRLGPDIDISVHGKVALVRVEKGFVKTSGTD